MSASNAPGGHTGIFAAAPGRTEVPAQAASDLLSRFARAIQRATIYPTGHPATRVATAPFVDTLTVLLRGFPQVVIGVTTDHMFVGTSTEDAVPHDMPWLSSRLSALDIATIRFDSALSVEDVEGLIGWIASTEDAPDTEPPRFAGCQVTKIDYAATRFSERAADTSRLTPEEVAWRSISRALLADWSEASDDEAPETAALPTVLASHVRRVIDLREGTGVTDLTTKLVGLNGQLAALPEDVRATVKSRLSEFVSALSPELRGQLLTVAPTNDSERLQFLTQMLDHLPRALVLEVINGVELVRGGTSHQFLSMMLKLTTVAASDAHLAEALELRYAGAGVPPDAVYLEPPRVRQLLEEVLSQQPGDRHDTNPEDYQARLDQLSTAPVERYEFVLEEARYLPSDDPAAASAHVGRIALMLLQAGSDDERQAACLDRLRQELPKYLSSGELELLADAAVQLVALSLREAPELAERANDALQFFTAPDTVRAVLHALVHSEDDPPAWLMMLARAGQHDFAEALFDLLGSAPDPHLRSRAAAILPALDFEVVRNAMTTVYRRRPASAKALLSTTFESTGLPLVVDVSHVFLGDRDVAVRLEAYRLLFAGQLSSARMDAVLRKAFDDEDLSVVDLALDEVQHLPPAVGVRPLARFLDSISPAHLEKQLHRAVQLLAAFRTDESRAALIDGLADRHRRLDAPSRRVSRTIASVLERNGTDAAVEAARAWRKSPAGMLSRVVGDGGDA